MVARGFCLTGLDGSREMLRFAAENAPGVEWLLADARAFHSRPRFDLAISIFESLNHVMTIDDLHAVFVNVFRALRPGGRFVFDLNRESAFQTFWNRKYLIHRADGICRAQTYYDDAEKVGYCDLTLEGAREGIPETSRLMIKHPLIIMLLMALSTSADFLILYGLHKLFSLKTVQLSVQTLSLGSAVNALVGSIIFQLVDRFRLKKEYA